MASGDNMKERLSQVTSRQKIIIVFMILVVLIIVWQVIEIMGVGSHSAPPAIQPVANKHEGSSPDTKIASGSNQVSTPTPGANNVPPSGAANVNVVQPGSIVNDPQFNRMQKITEEKYFGKLNELEELRIQRQIAEVNQAIAAAKLATVTAEKNISDLLTGGPGPSPAANQPGKTSADMSPPPGLPINGPAGEGAHQLTTFVPKVEAVPYSLVSVSLLLNRWTAVISMQNTMFTVGVGDTLPPDGSVVTNINKNSVTLRKDGKSRKLLIATSL